MSYEQFIELTDQLYWEGYAEQLAKDEPARFTQELTEFMNQFDNCHERQDIPIGALYR